MLAAVAAAALAGLGAGAAAAAQSASDDAIAYGAVSMTQGEHIYNGSCAGCHGGLGFGTMGPKLRGDANLSHDKEVVGQILVGLGEMPSFAGKLSDQEIADVSSYIRQSWGNSYGPVTPQRVSELRRAFAGEKSEPAE